MVNAGGYANVMMSTEFTSCLLLLNMLLFHSNGYDDWVISVAWIIWGLCVSACSWLIMMFGNRGTVLWASKRAEMWWTRKRQKTSVRKSIGDTPQEDRIFEMENCLVSVVFSFILFFYLSNFLVLPSFEAGEIKCHVFPFFILNKSKHLCSLAK